MSDQVDQTIPVSREPAADKPEFPIVADTPTAQKEEPASAPKAEDPAKVTDVSPATAQEPEPTKSAEPKTEKPAYLTKTPALGELFDRLPAILTTIGHDEMWGVQLKDFNDIPTVNVLIKYLRANEGNAKAAEDQLSKALQWRKDVNPQALAESGKYSAARYGGLGYLTTYDDNGKSLVFTWNIYGAVKDANATFANADE
jgi:hypothetical protein